MGPIGCSETSVRNYHYSLRNNTEVRSFHHVWLTNLELRAVSSIYQQRKRTDIRHKVLPITSHEGPEGAGCVALLYFNIGARWEMA